MHAGSACSSSHNVHVVGLHSRDLAALGLAAVACPLRNRAPPPAVLKRALPVSERGGLAHLLGTENTVRTFIKTHKNTFFFLKRVTESVFPLLAHLCRDGGEPRVVAWMFFVRK